MSIRIIKKLNIGYVTRKINENTYNLKFLGFNDIKMLLMILNIKYVTNLK